MFKRLTTNEFIIKATRVHKNKYDYSKVSYINKNTKVTIICKAHGEFEQTPGNHLNGHGCFKCAVEIKAKNRKPTINEFIEKAREIHNNEYDYSKINYINSRTKITVICKVHGGFRQTPHNHLKGHGCPECGVESIKLTTNEFIKKAIEIHGNKYNYSKVYYISSHSKVIIICSIHGEFEQMPYSHLNGQGCPRCNSSKGEVKIREYLITNNVTFEEQKIFNDCVYKRPLKFDFYLPETNTVIEYDGVFHFKETPLKNNLAESLIKDKIKDSYCIENNVNLIRIGFWENIEETLKKSVEK